VRFQIKPPAPLRGRASSHFTSRCVPYPPPHTLTPLCPFLPPFLTSDGYFFAFHLVIPVPRPLGRLLVFEPTPPQGRLFVVSHRSLTAPPILHLSDRFSFDCTCKSNVLRLSFCSLTVPVSVTLRFFLCFSGRHNIEGERPGGHSGPFFLLPKHCTANSMLFSFHLVRYLLFLP